MPFPWPLVDGGLQIKKYEHRSVQEMFAEKAAPIIVSSTQVAISNVDNNGAGLCRVTSSAHGLSTGDEVIIAGVAGTTEANGFWTVTVLSTTQFTLDSSSYANAYTAGGYVCNGVSYTVTCDATPSSPGILLLANLKKIASNGAVVSLPTIPKKLLATTEFEIFRSDISYEQAVSSIILTNNTASVHAGKIKVRSTKLYGVDSQTVVPWSLPVGYSMVIGGDGVRSMYTSSGLPYLSV